MTVNSVSLVSVKPQDSSRSPQWRGLPVLQLLWQAEGSRDSHPLPFISIGGYDGELFGGTQQQDGPPSPRDTDRHVVAPARIRTLLPEGGPRPHPILLTGAVCASFEWDSMAPALRPMVSQTAKLVLPLRTAILPCASPTPSCAECDWMWSVTVLAGE